MLQEIRRRLMRWTPGRCLLCQVAVEGLQPLCSGCHTALPWLDHACARCAEPLPQDADCCGACLQQPPRFAEAVCAFRYGFPVDRLLNRYKHNHQLHCGHWLAHLLADHLQAYYATDGKRLPQAIIPVPLHWRRLRSRGFDQALAIARVLARRLDLPLRDVLQRQRATASQQDLSREARQRNLRGAFAISQPLWGEIVLPSSVSLVDDVLTTGSTVSEITRVLQAHGVQQVHVWAVARTP